MQLELFSEAKYHPPPDKEKFTEELFEAYYSCRKNKRNTANALKFEVHLERNLFALRDEIWEGRYQPLRSIAFIVERPVKREVFAADFKDRVVHHFLINKLNPHFEQLFIPNSFACRVGKGTHFGINTVYNFIKSQSDNYQSDCYLLKLDIRGFFMHIDKSILWHRLQKFIHEKYTEPDLAFILELTEKVVKNEPAQFCIRKGGLESWQGLPNDKSLFHSPENCGLPIGNLSSQVFANFYLHTLDEFVSRKLGFAAYGRYVDDFIIIDPDKEKLLASVPLIRSFLKENLHLSLHPKKIYFQHYSKGVKYLGSVLKPGRKYLSHATKGNFYKRIHELNRVWEKNEPLTKEEIGEFLSSVNSYLGILKQTSSRRLALKMLQKNLDKRWWSIGCFNITRWKFKMYKRAFFTSTYEAA